MKQERNHRSDRRAARGYLPSCGQSHELRRKAFVPVHLSSHPAKRAPLRALCAYPHRSGLAHPWRHARSEEPPNLCSLVPASVTAYACISAYACIP